MADKTPRTDAEALRFGRLLVEHGTPEHPEFKTTEIIAADFARQLERENADLAAKLAEAQRDAGQWKKAAADRYDLMEKVLTAIDAAIREAKESA